MEMSEAIILARAALNTVADLLNDKNRAKELKKASEKLKSIKYTN